MTNVTQKQKTKRDVIPNIPEAGGTTEGLKNLPIKEEGLRILCRTCSNEQMLRSHSA
jgi:hypothetical protein